MTHNNIVKVGNSVLCKRKVKMGGTVPNWTTAGAVDYAACLSD